MEKVGLFTGLAAAATTTAARFPQGPRLGQDGRV